MTVLSIWRRVILGSAVTCASLAQGHGDEVKRECESRTTSVCLYLPATVCTEISRREEAKIKTSFCV